MTIKNLMKKMCRKKSTVVWMAVILLIIVMGFLAPVIAPHNPLEQNLEMKFAMPSLTYPMGTDNLGRCIFSRILYATRTTLGYSLLCTALAAVIGVTLGTIAGYKGGLWDTIIMRTCDVLYAFPALVLVMSIVGFIGVGIANIVIAMLILQWLWYARVSRNLAAAEREKNYIKAALVCGATNRQVIFEHILPNIIPNMLAIFTVDFGHTILSISGYSFLGLGVQAPNPEWGAMISEGRNYINTDPWLMFWPGLMILIVVVLVSMLGDRMRDALDSQSQMQHCMRDAPGGAVMRRRAM